MALKTFRDAVGTSLIRRKMSGRGGGGAALAACFPSSHVSLGVVSGVMASVSGAPLALERQRWRLAHLAAALGPLASTRRAEH